MSELAAFARLLSAVAPWSDRLVIVGGWAHRLYHVHPMAHAPAHRPLVTLDADLAFDEPREIHGDIRAALAQAGFRQNLFGEHTPPVAHYELGDDAGGFYAEFLTPLRGSGIKRTGAVDATVAAAGITAQKLRHLELLLVAPWYIRLMPGDSIPVNAQIDVRLPNPVSFLVQKLLIHEDRHPDKRAQDVLYLHDTLILFGAQEETLQNLWHETVLPSLAAKQIAAVRACLDTHFANVTDNIRRAATLPADRTLDPRRVQAVCEDGLRAICG